MKKRKFQTGGDVEEKKRKGLAASSGEKVGFLERLRMGNIDDPSSEAYRRFGAGRGAMPAPDTTPYSETADARNLMMAAARERAAMDTDESGIGRYARETGIGTLRQPAKEDTGRSAPKNFKQAFAAARKAGDKTFMFGGKKYTTELKKPAAKKDPDANKGPSKEVIERLERKSSGMKKGGMVSASKRADGCAIRGKTRGRIM